MALYYPTGELSISHIHLIINQYEVTGQKELDLDMTLPDGTAISVTPGTMFTLTIGADAPWTEVDYE